MANVDQYINQDNANRDYYLNQGGNLSNYLNNQVNQQNNIAEGYRGQADQAYGDLNNTPGYTASQAQQINGNPNAAFNYYDPSGLVGEAQANSNDLSGQVGGYQSGLNSAAGAGASGVTGAAKNLAGGVTSAAQGLAGGVTSAAQQAQAQLANPAATEAQWQGGVYNYLKGANDSAVGGYGTNLQSATDPNKLSVSQDFANSYKLSPEQAQNIKDVAAQTTGGQFKNFQDQAALSAAAGGNTSPAALAAIENNLGKTGAIAAGNAASSAELQANQTAADRAQTLQQMQLSANQDLASREAANAGNLYNAQTGTASNLANLESSGIQNTSGNALQGATTAANLGYNAAATGGAANLQAAQIGGTAQQQAAQTAGDYGYNAANSGGQAGIDASKYSGAQQLGVNQANQATGQGLATNADNTASGRAAGIANTAITGQNNYRNYLTGQQGQAQSGAQTNSGQAIQNLGTTSGAVNQASQTASQTATANNANNTAGANANKQLAGSLVSSFFADGGIATQPTDAIIGERGPEMVVPLNGYGSGDNMTPMNTQQQVPQSGAPTTPQQKPSWRGHQPGWRGDGSQVPGNQPGGANGQFGRYGQVPDQQPTPSFAQGVKQTAINQFNKSPVGQIAGAVQRYGQQRQQGQINNGMNDQMSQMRQGDMQSGADQMGQPSAPGADQPQGDQMQSGAINAGAPQDSAPQPAMPSADPPKPTQQQATAQQSGMASPFGQMNFGGAPQMASGGIVTKPTRAIIGEHGPEAVIPLDGHAGSKLTPGMMMPRRYNPTGPTEVKGPGMRPMAPAMMDKKMSNWKRWDSSHAG